MNRAEIIGHLGADPDVRQTGDGTPVANFRVATSERWTDKEGQKREITDWHNVTAWRHLATFAAKYVRKGSHVFVSGPMKTRSYEKDGVTRYVTEIVAADLVLLDRKPTEGATPVHDPLTTPLG